MAAGLAALRLHAGAAVALPALICRSVPDRLIRLGYVPRFVDSTADSPNPSTESLAEACSEEGTGGLLLLDLFGFLPEGRSTAAEAARASGCVVVEDRCHSALTQPGEEVADAVIYSIRKSLPSADGGALWLAEEALREPAFAALPFVRSVPFILARQLEQLVFRLGWPNIYADSVTAARRARQGIGVGEEGEGVSCATSSWLLSHQLHHATLSAHAAIRRRANYRQLAEAVRGMAPLFELPEAGTVPQVLPLADPSGELVGYLRDRGVGAYRWPGDELPDTVNDQEECFSNARRWNHEMVCLPIHQTIERPHIERMALLIDRFIAAGG
jgi:dTDP-4-amino-4,6-dideoxygalactose transaminase